MNELDRFHLISDVIDRVPKLGPRAAYAKQAIRDKLIEHKQYIAQYGDDMPEIAGWTWGQGAATNDGAVDRGRQHLTDGCRVMNVFCVRHGETEWSLSGQHTGVTDIPLTDNGRRARGATLRPTLSRQRFALVLVSPLKRARETCMLAGLGEQAIVDPDLAEWNYGSYEGITSARIHEQRPGWIVFRDGCPGGETPDEVGVRADRVIARALAADGDVALFAHGHILRTLAARWIGLPPGEGQRFLLDTGTLCILGFYRNVAPCGSGMHH